MLDEKITLTLTLTLTRKKKKRSGRTSLKNSLNLQKIKNFELEKIFITYFQYKPPKFLQL
jgi:hypothetical protein